MTYETWTDERLFIRLFAIEPNEPTEDEAAEITRELHDRGMVMI